MMLSPLLHIARHERRHSYMVSSIALTFMQNLAEFFEGGIARFLSKSKS